MLNFFVTIVFSLLLCQAQGAAKNKGSDRIGVTVPAAPWTLTLPHEGVTLENQQVKPDGRYGYFVLQDSKNKMTISLFIEPVDQCKTSKDCRDMVWKMGNESWEDPQNVVQGEIGDVSFFEFFMPAFRGVPVQQQHLYAEFVVDNFWIDLHVSKPLYKPEEHKLFENVIKSIKFEPKPKPN